MADEARMGWVVDVQNDFMLPDGRLYVRDLGDESDQGAVQVADRIERAVGWMRARCDLIVYTGDWHGYDDEEIDPVDPTPSRGTYPPHCMGRSPDAAEREGAAILEAVRPTAPVVLEIGSSPERAKEAARQALEEDRPVFIQKNRFDVFEGNDATGSFLRGAEELLGKPLRLYVVGVARDVCVTGAVDGLQARGYRVTALRDATWGLGLEPEEETLSRWRKGGAEVITSDALPG